MGLEASINTRLGSFAGLSSLIGTRSYAMKLPQNVTLPAVVFQRISTTQPHAFGADPTAKSSRFQVDVFDKGYGDAGQALAVAAQVKAALSRWSDIAGSPAILDILLESERHDYNPDTEMYRVIFDFIVWYRE